MRLVPPHVPRRWLYGLSLALITSGFAVVAARTPNDTGPIQGPYRPRMIVVPSGVLTAKQKDGAKGEGEPTPIEAFAIAETEVTQAQWLALMGNNPSQFTVERDGGPDHPVEQVSLYDALAYLNRLSKSEGVQACYDLTACSGEPGTDGFACPGEPAPQADCLGYRLPTDEEWTYAILAGSEEVTSDKRSLGEVGWFRDNGEGRTHPVGGLRPNRWGLRDGMGNVWEWAPGAVVRGCSWDYGAEGCRAAVRGSGAPGGRDSVIGFRPARSYPQRSNP